MVSVDVEVSCAAIIKKIMWLTTSSSVKLWPSSSCAWHSTLNMSVLSERRFSPIRALKYSSSVLRALMPRHQLSGGTGLRTMALPARVVVVNASLTVVTSSLSVPA